MTILFALVAVAGAPTAAKADILDAAQAGLILENTIPDLDFALITSFSGVLPGSTLNYGSTISATGFSDFLSGNYAGNVVNITYTSTDLASYTGPGVTWSTSGKYGTDDWIENGSAIFSFPTTTSFIESYSSTVTVGPNTGSFNLTINGSTSPDVEYLSVSGTSKANADATTLYPTAKDPFNPTPKELTSDDVCKAGKVVAGICTAAEEIKSADVIIEDSPLLIDAGTIQVVPEPSYLLLLPVALLGLLRRAGPRFRRS